LLFERNLAGVYVMRTDGHLLECNEAFAGIFGYASRGELLGEQPFAAYRGTPAWERFIARVREERTLPNLEAETRRRDGSKLWILAYVWLVDGPDGVPLMEGTVVDITERKQAEEDRTRSLRAQAALAETSRSLLSTLELEGLLEKVLQTARDAIPAAEKGSIVLWDEASRSLRVSATSGYQDPRVRDTRFPVTRGYAARAAKLREALVIPDARADPEIRYDGDVAEILSIQSALAAPLIARDQLFGVLTLDSDRIAAFTSEDATLLVAFASQAAMAIHNARLYERMRASEDRFARAFRASPAAITISTLSGGRYVDVNEAFVRLIGAPHAEIVGKTSLELGVWANAGDRWRMAETLTREGSLRDMASQLKTRLGEVRDVLISAEIIELEHEKCILALSHDITERRRAEAQITRLAYHDALTGLPNRVLFKDRLAQAIARAERQERVLAVLFLDLDHFKIVNDTLGHSAGDQLLQQVAERLSGELRKDDTVARAAGDEFTVLLAEISQPEDASRMAQKLLHSLSRPLLVSGHELFVTASIGVALFPADGHNGETLLQSADAAMYRAKEIGRSNYQLCTPGMNDRALERMAIENGLRLGLARGEFSLHYQPFIEAASGRIVGTEALVRWNHPEKGLLEADAFIPVAEASRLVVPLGEWVLRTACRQLMAWQAAGAGPLRMAVNLSARQFQQQDLPAVVRRILEETQVAPACLELEITETVAMHNVEWTAGVLRSLREMGVAIAIDDFGIGQSSLSYLRDFSISTLKIDRSFIRDVLSDPDDAAIVRVVIALAHGLRLKVIAEGVETQAQLDFLKQAGCHELQGYVFGRPCPAQELTATLVAG
jgi:diguanylate cyclase (GGDEF)-like protein/PAS domain S-box-containing protein